MSQSIELYTGGLQNCQSWPSGLGYIQQIPVWRPSSRELVVQWLGDGKISLDYGEDLRLLMAEPIAGMKLREAVQLLKEALLCNLDRRQ
jgi:hypothetical protein